MDLVVLKLYYPNRWRQNIGDLVSREDKKFNWFLCSKRYQDDTTGLYVAEMAVGTKFYDDLKGINYILKEPAKLIIVDDKDSLTSPSASVTSKLRTREYQGLACLIDCENPSGSIICPEALFGFIKEVLKMDVNEISGCPIIQYAKANYKCIRTKIPSFPAPADIDSVLDRGYSLSIVCKVLYRDITEYTSIIS